MVDAEKLHFKIRPGLYNSNRWEELTLQPFYTIHEARYMTYWQQLTAKEWEEIRLQVMAEEEALMRLNNRTLDYVATGEQQSDAGHVLQGTFGKGSYDGEFYVDAQSGQWFSYQLATQGVKENVSLMCRFHSADAGRVVTITVNGKKLTTMTLETKSFTGHYNWEYPIDEEMLMEDGVLRDSITVRFTASGNTPAPGLYYLRLLKDYALAPHYSFVCTHWVSGDVARVDKVTYDDEANTITVYGKQGSNNIALQYATYNDGSTVISADRRYFTVCGRSLKRTSGSAYLWWLLGANHGTQVEPTYMLRTESGNFLFVWDILESGLNDHFGESTFEMSSYGKAMNTVFGLTSSKSDGTAVISDINFYSRDSLVTLYPDMQKYLGEPTTISASPYYVRHLGGTYTMGGVKVDENADRPQGLYIVNGAKMLKR
jgi:hypothetical protein